MFKETSEEADRVLDILGNETRRRILYLLAQEPRYFIQISKDLGISQQAILKHLELLERYGLIGSYKAKSDFAAPERKYYHLNRSLYMSIGITKDDVNINLRNITLNQEEERKSFRDTLLSEDIEPSVGDDKNLNGLLKSSHYRLKKINERIGELERHKVSLMKLRQAILKRVHDAIRSNFDSDLERSVLYSLVTSNTPLDVEFLSERLNVREREIERCVELLKRRLTLPFE